MIFGYKGQEGVVSVPIFLTHLFGVSLISTFVYIKIYPLIFLLFIFFVFLFVRKGAVYNSVLFSLLLLLLYVAFVFLFLGKIDSDTFDALLKSILCVSFFLATMFVSGVLVRSQPLIDLLGVLEFYLRLIVLLSFLQIFFLYIVHRPAIFLETSADGNDMFSSGLVFWGVDNKNMFGAKVALYGFVHTLVYYIQRGRVVSLWFVLVLASSLLTLSRTALILYVVSFMVLYLCIVSRKKALLLIIALSVTVAYFGEGLFRFSNFINLELSDGASYRIIYWIAFFDRVFYLPLEGSGILAAREFLPAYAISYNNEPNLHNLFLNTYLDLGLFGSFFYSSFIFAFIYRGAKSIGYSWMFAMVFPAIFVGMSLYTSYDNDLWVYYSVIFILHRVLKERLVN